jgi:hypothetical protein
MLIRTTAIRKILRLRNRIKIIQGGTSAGKTFGILPILISKAAKRPLMEISVVAESIPHLRRGALKDFLSMMKSGFRYVDKRFNKSLLRYDFDNGSYIEFFSADDSSKLRGARRDILYINECNNIEFEAYNELAIRTKREIYLDFNPANEFWVHTELKNEPDTDFVVLTYKDNEALDKGIVREIEKNRLKGLTSSYWANWWNVYGLGEMGSLQGVVFSNWKQIDTKVKINKDGKAKEFKLIDKWEDVTIETYSKLMTFTNGTKSSEALATLTELSNIPKELLNQLELKHIVLMLEKLSQLQSQEDTTLKNIIEIDGVRYGFHPDFDEMTLGEYADIESFIKSGADKHLPEIMAVLYRPIKEEVDGVYTIEAYDGNIKIRTEIMRKMSATQVHSALFFLYHFSSVFKTIMQLSLIEVLQEMKTQS